MPRPPICWPEKISKEAVQEVYEDAPEQLRVWRIMRNVIHHVNRNWAPEDGMVTDQFFQVDKGVEASPDARGHGQPGPDHPYHHQQQQQQAAGEAGDEDDNRDEGEAPRSSRRRSNHSGGSGWGDTTRSTSSAARRMAGYSG
ncbi:hypothetical protein DL766_009857 [Monosporascus sp. MC13-8B]|uniref:Uncharacterized protein n=1 Tax=Monosporascus cannonballus TaxID=155416 RepID=A0ABY0GYG0_9PEZI|nr:hypothetical protein DL762_008790 [Monosporascus cannonballus]RYO83066.1 hypothetical protein DL763_008015 [Monosporascus cannonballus]RYP13443.1 hypothetical protein DL766_009857 [Monosporascus sp. MC13-8B]